MLVQVALCLGFSMSVCVHGSRMRGRRCGRPRKERQKGVDKRNPRAEKDKDKGEKLRLVDRGVVWWVEQRTSLGGVLDLCHCLCGGSAGGGQWEGPGARGGEGRARGQGH